MNMSDVPPSIAVEDRPAQEDWDSKAIGRPAVLVTPDSYWMWYPGCDSRAQFAIGAAVSADGETWTRTDNVPVIDATSLGGDGLHSVFDPVVVACEDTYLMLAATQGRRAATTLWGLTSRNGVDWRPLADNPVLDPEDGAAWERCGLAKPTVSFDGDRWHLWYVGGAACPSLTGIGHATSPDAKAWSRIAAHTVLRPGDGTWDCGEVTDPWVVFHDGQFHLWYAGSGEDRRRRIGYAISEDGTHWRRPSDAPVLEPDPSTALESGGLFAPVVVRASDHWLLWYGSADLAADGFRGFINFATSDDGMHWTRCQNNPVFRPSPNGFYLNPA